MPLRAGMEQYYGREWRLVHRPPILARASVLVADQRDELGGQRAWVDRERVDAVLEGLKAHDEPSIVRCECLGECSQRHPRRRCSELHRMPALTFGKRVFIQVAHLDQDPRNNAPDNLRAFCQACHNRYDALPRSESRLLTLSARSEEAFSQGNQTRFPFPGFAYRLRLMPGEVRVHVRPRKPA